MDVNLYIPYTYMLDDVSQYLKIKKQKLDKEGYK